MNECTMSSGRLILFFLFLLLASSCRKEAKPCNTNAPERDFPWLEAHIDSIDRTPCIIEAHVFEYRGNHSIYVRGCSELDESSYLFDCSGTIMCEFNVFGGVNTCTDFDDKSDYIGQIYPD